MSSLSKCITIFVSGDCNLNCIYCYSNNFRCNKHIDLEFAKKGMDDFFTKNNSKQLRLFGVGEATMAFECMQEIVSYAKYLVGNSLEVELQSNGYFSDIVADWIEENIDILWLSCDGPPDIQDSYRPTQNGEISSKTVIGNIKRFSLSKSCNLGVRSTVTSETNSRQTEIVEYFASLGVKHICADPIFLPVGYPYSGNNFPNHLLISDPENYVNHFLEAHNFARKLGISYNSILTVNLGINSAYGCRGCYTNPHLTIDGIVTCCDMAFSKNTPLKEMVLGKYLPDRGIIQYDSEKINRVLNRRIENLSHCDSCKWKLECSGGCFGEALNEGRDIFAIKKFSCQATRYLLERIDRKNISRLGHP